MVPISVKSADHSTRELAFAAQRYAKAAQRNSFDFEAIYNHGLALQELASRVTSSRDEQMRLLQQVLPSSLCIRHNNIVMSSQEMPAAVAGLSPSSVFKAA